MRDKKERKSIEKQEVPFDFQKSLLGLGVFLLMLTESEEQGLYTIVQFDSNYGQTSMHNLSIKSTHNYLCIPIWLHLQVLHQFL